MGKLIKSLLLLALVAVALVTASYLGARATAGKIVGSNPPLTQRTIEFAYRGMNDLPGRPRGWVIRYGRTQLPGIRSVAIYVSLKGDLLQTAPRDLQNRIEAWERAQEPGP